MVEAQDKDAYTAPSLRTEGFIHCSQAHQVAATANRIFAGEKGLVVLEIDPDRLTAPVKLETSDRGDKHFPHVYGPIEAAAVMRVYPLQADADGRFTFTEALRLANELKLIPVPERRAYSEAGLPSELDYSIASFLEEYGTLDSAERERARLGLVEGHGQLLRAFAERAASLALRTGRVRWLALGVQAVSLGYDFTADWRDEVVRLMPLYDSAARLGCVADEVFTRAANHGSERGAAFIGKWLAAPAENKTLWVMGYELGEDGVGPRYRHRAR